MLSKFRNKSRMSTLATSIQHYTGGLNKGNYARKINKKPSRLERKKQNYLYWQMTQTCIQKILRNPLKNN